MRERKMRTNKKGETLQQVVKSGIRDRSVEEVTCGDGRSIGEWESHAM